MKPPRQEEYQRSVALARAAIREERNAPPIRADRSLQALLARMEAKFANGEALTEADFGAMAAAVAEAASGKRRRRGRPKGARADGYRELWVAICALEESGLQPYRNNTGPRLSQCDAIAEAMWKEGFRTLSSYDAARREMVEFRKHWRSLWPAQYKAHVAAAREISRAWTAALEPLRRQFEGIDRLTKALRERIREQKTFPPEPSAQSKTI